MGNSVAQPEDLDPTMRDAVFEGEVDVKQLGKMLKSGNYKSIVVMTGAGISVGAGIPDFRSSTGLYSILKEKGVEDPQEVFSISCFRRDPKVFYTCAKEIFPGKFNPTPAHFFTVLLHKKGLLLRQYTQNVDNLERLAGVPPAKLVEAHGSFSDAHCQKCGGQYSLRSLRKAVVDDGIVPRCQRPKKLTDSEVLRRKLAQMRLADSGESSESPESPSLENPDVEACGGVVKPDIVLFGEALPERFGELSEVDMPEADLLIVMGTSLVVFPFAGLPARVGPYCPRLLINREPSGVFQRDSATSGNFGFRFFEKDNYRDVWMGNDCDDGIRSLCELCGWTEDLDALIAEYQSAASENFEVLANLQGCVV